MLCECSDMYNVKIGSENDDANLVKNNTQVGVRTLRALRFFTHFAMISLLYMTIELFYMKVHGNERFYLFKQNQVPESSRQFQYKSIRVVWSCGDVVEAVFGEEMHLGEMRPSQNS